MRRTCGKALARLAQARREAVIPFTAMTVAPEYSQSFESH
jgi:hypothetical protein